MAAQGHRFLHTPAKHLRSSNIDWVPEPDVAHPRVLFKLDKTQVNVRGSFRQIHRLWLVINHRLKELPYAVVRGDPIIISIAGNGMDPILSERDQMWRLLQDI